jgi:serine/threonine-protein kinase
VPEGSEVTTSVTAAGSAITVPRVVGLSESEAIVEIANAGLVVAETTEVDAGGVAEGTVVSSDPPPGTAVLEGTRVSLTVAR